MSNAVGLKQVINDELATRPMVHLEDGLYNAVRVYLAGKFSQVLLVAPPEQRAILELLYASIIGDV